MIDFRFENRKVVHDGSSQQLCFGFDIRPEMRAEAASDNDIDPARQEIPELLDQCQVIVKAAIRCEIDQQIDVAVRPFLMTHDRTEQADIRGAMSGGDGEKHISLVMEILQ